MDANALVSTAAITLVFVVPIAAICYALYRVGWYFRLAKTEDDIRFKMFTLAALASLVVGEKVIMNFDPSVFSQEIFVVMLTMPVSLFYYNYFMRERSLKTKTVERFHAELIVSSCLSCIAVALLMRYMAP